MLSIKGKVKQTVVIHTIEYYSTIKRNDCYSNLDGSQRHIMQNIEEIFLKRLYTVWFHLNDILENEIIVTENKSVISKIKGGVVSIKR